MGLRERGWILCQLLFFSAVTQKEKEKAIAGSLFHLIGSSSSMISVHPRNHPARQGYPLYSEGRRLAGGWQGAGADLGSVPTGCVSGSGSTFFMLPGGLSAIDWGVPPECSPPFFPAGLEGRFRSPSLSCAHCWKAARPWTWNWDLLCPGRTRRGGRGWLGAFLSHGSVATGPLFQKLLDLWSSGKEAWGLSGRHPVSLQADPFCSHPVSISSARTHSQ